MRLFEITENKDIIEYNDYKEWKHAAKSMHSDVILDDSELRYDKSAIIIAISPGNYPKYGAWDNEKKEGWLYTDRGYGLKMLDDHDLEIFMSELE